MADFTVGEMQDMQRSLQEKYKEYWRPLSPERGKDQLLWMIAEIGEVIDILKKQGAEKANADPETRAHFVEELADVLMYYNDVLLCYGITPDELGKAYRDKFEKNMDRW